LPLLELWKTSNRAGTRWTSLYTLPSSYIPRSLYCMRTAAV
jgi:hypothetical protein